MNAGNTSTRTGGTFLKANHLPELLGPGQSILWVDVDARATSREAAELGEFGPRPGRYGLDVPIHIGNETYIATVPEFTEDYAGLLAEFGADLDAWAGQSMAVWPDAQTGYLRFASAHAAVQGGLAPPPPVAHVAPRPAVLMPHQHGGPAAFAGGPAPTRMAPPSNAGNTPCADCGAYANRYINGVPYCETHWGPANFRIESANFAREAERRAQRAAQPAETYGYAVNGGTATNGVGTLAPPVGAPAPAPAAAPAPARTPARSPAKRGR